MMKKFISLLMIVLMALACTRSQFSENVINPLDESASFEAQLSDHISYVILKTDKIYSANQSVSLKVHKGHYYIMDKRGTIDVFDENGDCVLYIEKVGRGPGEYLHLYDFIIANDNIIVLCNYGTKVIKYSNQGEFLNEYELPFYATSFVPYEEGYIFSRERRFDETLGNDVIVVTDTSFNVKHHYLPKDSIMGGDYGSKISESLNNSSFLYKDIYDNNLYELDEKGLIRKYSLDLDGYDYPNEFYAATTMEDAYNAILQTNAYNVDVAMFNDRYLFISLSHINGLEILGYRVCLYDKYSNKHYVQSINTDDNLLFNLAYPQLITPDNEILYITNTSFLKQIYSHSSQVYTMADENEVIIKYSINH